MEIVLIALLVLVCPAACWLVAKAMGPAGEPARTGAEALGRDDDLRDEKNAERDRHTASVRT